MKWKHICRKLQENIVQLAPVLGLLILSIIYYFAMDGQISLYNLKVILNQVVIVAIVATGATFIYSMGAFDISLGAATAVSAMCGAVAVNRTGSIAVMLLTCLGVGIVIGLFNSTLAALFHLPVFVTTIAMLSILGALTEVILNGQSQLEVASELVSGFDNIIVKLLILIVFGVLCYSVFELTPVGRMNKFLGSNPVSAKQTGISSGKMSIIAFFIAGIGVGLGAFLTIVRAPVLGKTTASSIGMDVLIAIVFGGMPISGGARSKITAAMVGSISIVLLNQILPVFGFSSGISQIVKAVMFLLVVFCAGLGFRDKTLPR
ncbi:MAG: inner-membrane translocator [bacterium]|nr:inner-membrane translocator [bacterium]